MSELIQKSNNRTTAKWQLLASVSALALVANAALPDAVSARDEDRPTVWIELGGQMELMQGIGEPITAPFMTALSPTPGPYHGDIFFNGQKPSRHAFGYEGKLTFQPENSDLLFSAGIRYGRSHSKRHIHNQTQVAPYVISFYGNTYSFTKYPAPFADTKSDNRESHTVIDFMAGKDVGLGMFGRDGTSTINAGVRFAQFSSRMTLDVQARPTLYAHPFPILPTLPKYFEWDQYSLSGHADRSFHGVGPSLSWNGSAGLLGNHDNAELMLDWSINAAVLFGRQKASTSHQTKQRHEYGYAHSPEYPVIYQTGTAHTRSRSVAVPNIGGAIGFSVKYPNAKVSLGYRADFFFGAMDTGIDARHTKDVGFSGPYASISVGL